MKLHTRFTKLVLAVAVLLVTTLAGGSVAAAESAEGPPCTIGEALAGFEAPFEHIIGDFTCQYRLFFDGQSFTYCEDDVILGGLNRLATYQELQELGWSRAEGIAYLERYEERVWLDGIERQLMGTAWKDGQHPTFGHVVYVQHAFITQLLVGDHVSYMEQTFDGALVASATVQLHILSRTDALCS